MKAGPAGIGLAGPPFGRLGRFAGVGVASTALYAALGALFAHVAGLSPLAATVAAYLLAAAFSYAAHRRITFRSDRAHRAAAPRFAMATLCGFGLATGLTVGAERLGLPYALAIAATCAIVPAFNFIVLDRLVFARSGPRRPAP